MRNAIIQNYRALIDERYQFNAIKKKEGFPKILKKESVEKFKDFFLNYLYAPPAQRQKLDDAFKQLESYISHPQKIMGIIGNLAFSIFKFGSTLPLALRAGKSALNTHLAARNFEASLEAAALNLKLDENMNAEQFKSCLAALPKQQLNDFIEDLATLFVIITNPKLLGKTIEIMQEVLEEMKRKTTIYTADDTDAIQLGIDIFTKGSQLLKEYDDAERSEIINFIVKNEKQFIDSL